MESVYADTDLATNAYLYVLGYRPVQTVVDDRGRVVFRWVDTLNLKEDLTDFRPGGKLVNAFEYAAAYRDIKAMVNSTLRR